MKLLLGTLIALSLFACQTEKKKTVKEPQKIEEKVKTPTVLDENVILQVEFQPTYLNPQSKPYVLPWSAYLDLQNDIYKLKKIESKEYVNHLNIIKKSLDSVYKSKIPKALKTSEFESKLLFLEDLILNANDYTKNSSVEEIQINKNNKAILEAFKATKNYIRNLYASIESNK